MELIRQIPILLAKVPSIIWIKSLNITDVTIILCVCSVRRVILCSGKHYYALDAYRKEKGLTNTALIRLEVS